MINKAQTSLGLLKKFHFITGLKTEDRIRVFKGVIRPRFDYGLNIVSRNSKLNKKLDSSIHKLLCALLHIGTNSSKLGIRRILGINSTEERRVILRNKLVKRIGDLQLKNDTKNPIVYLFNNLHKRYIFTSLHTKKKHKPKSQLQKMAIEYTKGGEILKITKDLSWKGSGINSIPEPERSGKVTGIAKENSRILLLYILRKYPGVETVCALCKKCTHNFYTHIKACSKVPIETKESFKPLNQISKLRWEDITTKKQLID